jgi:UDP-2,4-diacetamido-2,4,6-trideoxy-beta-L-altropyranose hydrolase
MEVLRLDVTPGSSQDAAQTARVALERGAAWVVADGYGFGAGWQKAIKDAGLRLLLWDDYGHAEHYSADLVLNQNFHAVAGMYSRREPYTRLLLGPRYAQIRGEFLEWRDRKREIPAVVRKVLVTMGGADPDHVTGKVVQALARLPNIEAVIVAGGDNPNIEALRSAVAPLSSYVRLAVDAQNMPELMAWADIAVLAAGSTCLELAFMGLPAVVVPISANQESAAKALGGTGLALAVAPATEGRQERLASAVSALLSTSEEIRSAMSAGLRRLVDGGGAERLVHLLLAAKVTLRRISLDDRDLLWQWANDPSVRNAAFCSDPVLWDEHVRWFETKCGKPETIWCVAYDARRSSVGQVRIDLDAMRKGTVDISVAPEHRGQGMATSILCAALEYVFDTAAVNEVHAYVKPENTASVRSFERAGFERVGMTAVDTNPAVHLVCRASDCQTVAQ